MANLHDNSELLWPMCCVCGTPVDETVQRLDYCDVCTALLCPDCQKHHVCGEGAIQC
jgi:hypothetical protein